MQIYYGTDATLDIKIIRDPSTTGSLVGSEIEVEGGPYYDRPAFKYTRAGGDITIESETDDEILAHLVLPASVTQAIYPIGIQRNHNWRIETATIPLGSTPSISQSAATIIPSFSNE